MLKMQPIKSIETGGPLELLLASGDIVQSGLNAIVNSVNEQMMHGGGVALSIATAAGKEYELYSQKLVSYGALSTNQVYVSKNYQICCKHIFNIVCPRYTHGMSIEQLRSQYTLCLEKACTLKLKSIAFPLLGAGIFGWPVEQSLKAFLAAMKNLPSRCHLKEVYLVEKNEIILQELEKLAENNIISNNSMGNQFLKMTLAKVWYFKADNEQWTQYRQKLQDEINANFDRGIHVFEMAIDGKKYKFDLLKKFQMNILTGNTRPISDTVPLVNVAQWKWRLDNKEMQSYSENDNRTIENAYNSGQKFVELVIKRFVDDQDCDYRIDFTNSIQIQLKTSYKREVERVEAQKPVGIVIEITKSPQDTEIGNKLIDINGKLWFIGIGSDSVSAAMKEFEEKNKKLYWIEKIDDPDDLTEDDLKRHHFKLMLNPTKNYFMKNYVKVYLNENNININGQIKSDVLSIKEEIIRVLLSKRKVKYPGHWKTHNTKQKEGDKKFECVEVSLDSDEWKGIETEFKKTLEKFKITKIDRIENKYIWKHYSEEQNYLKETKKRELLNEVQLWHGTRGLGNLCSIYNGDKNGLDVRYSNDGMWGRGIYFAQNASYSHNYANVNTATGERVFFYCSVLLSDYIALASDKTLKMPPLKTNAASSENSNLEHDMDRYDSVKGNTNGSDVFIVYENEKTYPAYKITYSPC